MTPVAALAGLLLLSVPALGASRALVYYGWGIPETSWVREHWASMDEAPFDGTAFVVAVDRAAWRTGKRGVDNQLGWQLFGLRRFSDADLAPALDDLRAARFRGLTQNFVPVCPNSRPQGEGFSWFDARRWEIALENWRTVVRFARQAGLRGIILDPEDYGGGLFRHDPTDGVDLEEHRRIVQRRAYELIAATRDVFPDLTILALYGHTLALHDDHGAYALYPAFLDGMLEAAPAEMQLVDGYEFAYGFQSRDEFARGRRKIREAGRALSRVPEAYDRHVQVGFGLWLDHGGPRKWHPDEPHGNHFTPADWRSALEAALETSDRWVWVYSQRPGFFPPRDLPVAYAEATERARLAARH